MSSIHSLTSLCSDCDQPVIATTIPRLPPNATVVSDVRDGNWTTLSTARNAGSGSHPAAIRRIGNAKTCKTAGAAMVIATSPAADPTTIRSQDTPGPLTSPTHATAGTSAIANQTRWRIGFSGRNSPDFSASTGGLEAAA